MSRGVKILIISLILLLLGASGGGYYLWTLSQRSDHTAALSTEEMVKQAEEQVKKDLETAEYVNLDEIITELKDQTPWVKLQVSVAFKKGTKLEELKKMEPLITRTVLFEVRSTTAKQLEGAIGQANLEKTLHEALLREIPSLKGQLVSVLITQLALQQ